MKATIKMKNSLLIITLSVLLFSCSKNNPDEVAPLTFEIKSIEKLSDFHYVMGRGVLPVWDDASAQLITFNVPTVSVITVEQIVDRNTVLVLKNVDGAVSQTVATQTLLLNGNVEFKMTYPDGTNYKIVVDSAGWIIESTDIIRCYSRQLRICIDSGLFCKIASAGGANLSFFIAWSLGCATGFYK